MLIEANTVRRIYTQIDCLPPRTRAIPRVRENAEVDITPSINTIPSDAAEEKDTIDNREFVDEVQRLLGEAENPFEIDERLEELVEELQAEYPDHEMTAAGIDAVERNSPPCDERVSKLIR